ncbi:MAG TPA: 2-amino-4-oxopentanoate thiolase subunit OrtB [bacterium]|nr:2-amino-4-oxopentanoate thiolase subunit OrtB [bacterium]
MDKRYGYEALLARKNEIMKNAMRMDYSIYETGKISFDYEKMMNETGYSLEEIRAIQSQSSVGNTPLIELTNLTRLARKLSAPGYGARIFIKDEATNPSGSFKARRAAVSVYHAKRLGYKGVIAATSGNYGAAIASQAAMKGLNCIIVQEVYDSKGAGQPEIIEKGRKCEAYGAEVVQLTVGPELFYVFLRLLEETGYFNCSLYTPFAIAGIETLGAEIVQQVKQKEGKPPTAIVVTHAGGGNLTGTARGVLKAGYPNIAIIGASVNLEGLHMASDHDFNRKSFTTGHTGFGVPFATWPDRTDVPRNAARPLRYMDRYVTVTQGDVFFMTEALAQLEGIERGPAGNTSLAAAFAIAQELKKEEIIVVQETEYTGAGKHPTAQLTFARQQGVEVRTGNPSDDKPGERIIIPEQPNMITVKDLDLNKIRTSYLRNSTKNYKPCQLEQVDLKFLAQDTKTSIDFVKTVLGVE